jgi:[glutamine synthetase] adenylyltransferase / [glutamine synthetase]-adenylyl-L-tyrosine phosphorylase
MRATPSSVGGAAASGARSGPARLRRMVIASPDVEPLVERSAAPERVRAALARWEAARPGVVEHVAADPVRRRRAVAVLAASRSLGDLLVRDEGAVEALVGDAVDAPSPDASFTEVVTWWRRELLRVAALDLVGERPLEATVAALSAIASEVLGAAHGRAVAAAGGEVRLAVIGMGKLGARELNYSSDADILLVGDGEPAHLERAGRAVLELAGRCFRVDADLRPEGRDGPLVRTVAAYDAYWRRWAEPWERQALLKARPVAGDPDLGGVWQERAAGQVWEVPFTADDLRHVRTLKARAEAEVRRRGLAERDVKRGPGGIRDVEFATQLLQLVHGRVDAELRTPGTLDALAALARGGYVDEVDATALAEAYRFLRRVEHAVQLEDERQSHVVPVERSDRRRIARVLGYQGRPEAGPTELLDRELRRHRHHVRSVYERVWFRPLLDALAGAGSLGAEAASARLAAFGFRDVERTRQAVVELTTGLTRSSRMMQQLLPLILGWLSDAPDPDLGLLGLRRLASGEARSRAVAAAFRDSPEVARHLSLLLGTSRMLGDVLVANPDLVERLPDPDRLRTGAWDELVTSAGAAMGWRAAPEERQRAVQRWKQRQLLGIAARDVFGHAGVEVVGADLTALAEACIDVALAALEPRTPFAVVALGRLGGAELGYASDLDLAFVHGTGGRGAAAAADEAERIAAGLLRFLGGDTPAERVFAVDVSLRPEGRTGPLSRSLEGWRSYLDRWASTWERQAYLRVRAVGGDETLGAELVGAIAEAVWGRPFDDDDAREVRRMKARIERERLGPGTDPEFHLKLGRGSLSDIEFTVQLLQLRTGLRGARTLGALDALVEEGHLATDEAEVLVEAYRFCERARNRTFLVAGPGDALPLRPEQAGPLARSLGFTIAGLRAEYRRVTRRARRVVERRFYERL